MSNPSKAAMRAQVAAALAALTPSSISSQSAAVLSQLNKLPAYNTCTSASIYLPMDGGQEIDTWPIVAELMSRGCRVAVPKVCGRQPTDMRMLRLASLEQAQSFPLTKWGIPEPDAATQAAMEDATEANDLSVLFVPAVAFDARCGRLGHGRGYYDAFIARQRALARGSGSGAADKLTVIGLALSEQVVESVPMVDGHDQRLDFVLTPDGPLAYTSAADVAKAAAMMGGGAAIGVAAAAGSTAAAEAAEADFSDDELAPVKSATPSVPDLASRVEIAKGGCSLPPVLVTRSAGFFCCDAPRRALQLMPAGRARAHIFARLLTHDPPVFAPRFSGKFKYACLRVTAPDGTTFLAVRSGPGSYHADVADPFVTKFSKPGYKVSALGGGRIMRIDGAANTVEIYGFSVGFGGACAPLLSTHTRTHAQAQATHPTALDRSPSDLSPLRPASLARRLRGWPARPRHGRPLGGGGACPAVAARAHRHFLGRWLLRSCGLCIGCET